VAKVEQIVASAANFLRTSSSVKDVPLTVRETVPLFWPMSPHFWANGSRIAFVRPARIWNRRQHHVAAVVRDFPLERDNVGRPVREKIEPADLLRRLHDLETEILGVGDRDAALSSDRKKIKRAETICPHGFGPGPFSPSSSRAWESFRRG
jgi:hypothetical protein